MKCPHKELLSVYFDGELPSPWKEKMDRHAAECAECARTLADYKSFSLKPADTDIESVNAARERIWQKLELGVTSPAVFTRRMPGGNANWRSPIWRRRLSIPLPAAAAAAVLFIALAAFLFLRSPGMAGTPDAAIAAEKETPDIIIAAETEFDVPGIIPVTDMESVLQYLGSRDTGDMLILRLPDSRNFVNYGEPKIIRAADYSQQMTRQRKGSRIQGQQGRADTQDWRKP